MSSSTPLRPPPPPPRPRLEVGEGADDELLMQMETEFTLNGGSSVNSNAHATAAGANGSGGGGGSADSGGGLDVAMVEEHRVSPSNVSTRSQDSCQSLMDAEEKGQLEVRIRPAEFLRTNSQSSSAAETGMQLYEMDASPRGLALIVEIEEYDNDVQEKRVGSQFDVDNLTGLFEGLSFKVDKRKNLNKREFDNLLYEFANRPEHRHANMMIMAVLSHGRDGHVYTSDGLVIATESIYEKFNNSNCPALKGKPKFFIIQACRGDETDTGHVSEGDGEVAAAGAASAMRPSARKRRAPGAGGMDASTFSDRYGEMNKARPTWEDMIIAYSTIPGFASMRDHEKGTWFVQSMVEVFMNHAYNLELIDLLRMTSEYLSRFTNEFQEKQTCNVEMRHLYKRIYFNPGLHRARGAGKLKRSQSTPPASPRRTRGPDGGDGGGV